MHEGFHRIAFYEVLESQRRLRWSIFHCCDWHANLLGTIAAGALGKYFPKKNLLSLIYVGRTIAAAVFIMMPITSNSVLLFSAVMGGLWLATVPLPRIGSPYLWT